MRIFSRWKAQPVTDRDRADAHLINAAIDIHRDDPEFGYRFISDELPGKGITASLNRVSRLCTQQRLWSVHITERTTGEGKLYLCTVKDACSRRIVGYSIAERMTAQRAVDALSNAVLRRRPVATVVHSDRGSQFRTHAFVHALGTHRLQGSMGTGPRLGRQRGYGVALLAAAEDRPQPPPLATRQQLRLAIISWIENTYHRRRRRKTLGRLTPIEFEILNKPLPRPDRPYPNESTEVGADRSARRDSCFLEEHEFSGLAPRVTGGYVDAG